MKKIEIERLFMNRRHHGFAQGMGIGLLFLVTLSLSLVQFVDLKTMPADTLPQDEGMGIPGSEGATGILDEMGAPAAIEQEANVQEAEVAPLPLPTEAPPFPEEAQHPLEPAQEPASLAFVPETKAAPTGEIPVTPSSSPSTTDSFNQEWEQIKNDVEAIDQLETKVLEQMRQLDDSLDTAMDESVNARKVSIEMLNITDETAAQANLNKLKEHLNKVKQIQTQMQQEFSKNFDVTLTEIQNKMQSVRDRVKILEKQGLITESELEKQVTVEVPRVEDIIEKEEESFLFKNAVAVVAGTIKLIKKLVKWTKSVIDSGVSKSKKEEAVEPSNASDMAQPGPGMAPPPGLSVPVAQAQPETLPQAGPEMQELDKSMEQIQQEKTQIAQTRKKLKNMKNERSGQLQKKIAMIEEKLGTKLSAEKKEELKEILVKKYTGWRGAFEYLFDKTLDLLAFIGKKIRLASISFYEDFLKKKFRRFLYAVEKRVGEIEQEETSDQKTGLEQVVTPQGSVALSPVEPVPALAPAQAPGIPEPFPAESGMGPAEQSGGNIIGAPEEMTPPGGEMMGAPEGEGMGAPGETGPPTGMGI